jgi:hypothetical protein
MNRMIWIWMCGILSLSSGLRAQVNPGGVLLLDSAALEVARDGYRSGGTDGSPLLAELFRDAEDAMRAPLLSIVQKKQVPPSGSKHDYMSLAPYWWPDSAKPDGLPYVRRDGEVNPEYRQFGDNERMDRMQENVTTLALAFAISGKESYADRGVKQLKVWFLDSATRMTPHLNFAQAIRGVNAGRGIGIIETYGFRNLIDGMLLLRSSGAWTDEIQSGMSAWCGAYLDWLLTSQNGRDEAGWKNNHGSAYDVQVSCVALFVGRSDVAGQVLRTAGERRIAVQIEPDGSQPLELERTKSWGYSNMNLDALMELALLGERFGIDLWNYTTNDGRCIRKAIDFLLPYALGERRWAWVQFSPLDPERMYWSTGLAASRYHDERYRSAHLGWKRRMTSSRANLQLPVGQGPN